MVVLYMNMYGVMFIGVKEEYESKISIDVRHGFVYIPATKLKIISLRTKKREKKVRQYILYFIIM